jgi:hypothetical protein
MLAIINPFVLYIASACGALGIMWLFKYSNVQILNKIIPVNKFRFAFVLISLTNLLLFIYLMINGQLISTMLVDPGFIVPNEGSGSGFFWNDKLSKKFNDKYLNNFEFYKKINDYLFILTTALLLITASYYGRYKKSLFFTTMLGVIAFLISSIFLFVVINVMDELVIWEGG